MFSFMFVCKSECDVADEKFRDFVFEIIAKKLKSVLERFDTKFSVRNPRLKKKKKVFWCCKYKQSHSSHSFCEPKRVYWSLS